MRNYPSIIPFGVGFTNNFNDYVYGTMHSMFDKHWHLTDVDVDSREYHVRLKLPFFTKEEIKVETLNDSVIVSAENGHTKFIRAFGYFDADAEHARIRFEDGILKIDIPRIAPKSCCLHIE